MAEYINKQDAFDIVEFECGEWRGLARTIVEAIEQLSPAEPDDIDAAFYKAIEVLENDPIRRQDAIDAIYDGTPPEPHYPAWYVERIRAIPKVCVDACDIFPDEEGADDKSE